MKKYELYIMGYCPYCQKVIRFIQNNNIPVEIKDIDQDKDALDKLIKVGGKKQVPCLFVDGNPMYESSDIIQYLKTNKE